MNRRTSLIAAAAITGTVLAGTTAVAANVGILNSADSGPIGDLSAVAEIAPEASTVPTTPQVIDVYIEEPVASTTGTVSTTIEEGSTGQEFRVDDAGTVTIERTVDGLRLADVVPRPGWEWTSEPSPDGSLAITFTDGESTYVFRAVVAADGSIDARVEEPVVQTIVVPAETIAPNTSAPASGGTWGADHDQYESDDDHDEYEYESDDDHEEYEYESDDHDEYEYEGGDDDD